MSIPLTRIGDLAPDILKTARKLEGWREDYTHLYTDGVTHGPEHIRGICLTPAALIHDALYFLGDPDAPTAIADRMHCDLLLLNNLLWIGLTWVEAGFIYEQVRLWAAGHFGNGNDPAWNPR